MTSITPLSLSRPLDELAAHRWALAFAGQPTPWRAALYEAAETPRLKTAVDSALRESSTLLAPVLPELDRITGGKLNLWDNPAPQAFASVPGILAAQFAALIDFTSTHQDLNPHAILGHSQGLLAAELARKLLGSATGAGQPPQPATTAPESRAGIETAASFLACARLIGAAATAATRRHCAGVPNPRRR